MNNKRVLPLSLLVRCFFLAYFTTVLAKPVMANIKYPSVAPNASYSSVTELSYRDADKKIQYGEDSLQYALLWKAGLRSSNMETPLVILIHGGCWLNTFDIKHTFPMSTKLAQAGYDVWSLEYRRTGDEGGGWPGTFEDIKQGILAVTQYNDDYALENTIVAGHSAGGHLALLAGSELENIRGVIGLAAIANIEQYSMGTNSCQSVTKNFMQGIAKNKPRAYALANPIERQTHPNVMLLQGDADSIVPMSQALNSGMPFTVIEKAGHFDWIHPGSDAFISFIKTLEVMSNPDSR